MINEAIAIDPADPLPYLGLAIGNSTAGHTSPVSEDASARSKSYALKALSLDSTLADAHVVLAETYSVLGEKDKAIDCLEIVYKNRGDFMPWMEADYYFKPLLNDPEFKEIADRLNLPE